MSSFAELTAALTAKDSEKASFIAEIDAIKDLQEQEFVGTLSTSVVHVDNLSLDAEFSIHFLVNTDLSRPQSTTESKGLADPVSLLLKSFDQTVEIRVVVNDESYSAVLNVNDVPGDAIFMTELDAAGQIDESKRITLHVKAQADFFHALIESKERALAQATQEFEDIALQIKEAKRKEASKDSKEAGAKEKKTGPKKKGDKAPKKKVAPAAAARVEETEEVQTSALGDLVARASEAATLGLALVTQHRAVLLFGVASAGMFFLGDYASV